MAVTPAPCHVHSKHRKLRTHEAASVCPEIQIQVQIPERKTRKQRQATCGMRAWHAITFAYCRDTTAKRTLPAPHRSAHEQAESRIRARHECHEPEGRAQQGLRQPKPRPLSGRHRRSGHGGWRTQAAGAAHLHTRARKQQPRGGPFHPKRYASIARARGCGTRIQHSYPTNHASHTKHFNARTTAGARRSLRTTAPASASSPSSSSPMRAPAPACGSAHSMKSSAAVTCRRGGYDEIAFHVGRFGRQCGASFSGTQCAYASACACVCVRLCSCVCAAVCSALLTAPVSTATAATLRDAVVCGARSTHVQ
jgi:hypothetical protein